MDAEKIRTSITKADLAMTEARERLQTIMTTYMAEAIEQIGQTLEACQVKKNRLIDRLEEVYTAVEAVRNECSTIDANIANKVLYLNKLATQIVQQMAQVQIPDLPPPMPSTIIREPIELDLSPVNERLNHLDDIVNDLKKVVSEKEETIFYMINTRPSFGNTDTNSQGFSRSSADVQTNSKYEEQIQRKIKQLKKVMRSIPIDDHHRSKSLCGQHTNSAKSKSNHDSKILTALIHDGEVTEYNTHENGTANHFYDNEEIDEPSRSSDTTVGGPCVKCREEQTTDMAAKESNIDHSIGSEPYTERPDSAASCSSHRTISNRRRLGEALASNDIDICYYDYEQQTICVSGVEDYSIKFKHGFVVDLCWSTSTNEWLILSEQGLYRWNSTENEYRTAYQFNNGEIGFRRIALTDSSIFCLFRYSVMLLELSISMQTKQLHALAPPEDRYRKLGDVATRKILRADGGEEDILGLIWFGSGPGIILEERFLTPVENNADERLFRHVVVRKGRFARLSPYDNGQAWLISNTGEAMFRIVDNTNITIDRRDAKATWVEVSSGIPINAVGHADTTVCIRLEGGKLEYRGPTSQNY